MRDLAGVVSFAVATLWIAYLVPHRLRHRQQLLESRADDRFSGALRVLAVTDRAGRDLRAAEARSERGPDAGRRAGLLLTPSRGIPVQGHGVVAVRGGGIVERPHGTQDRISADAVRRAAQRRAARAASLARRAAAARRRGVLTLALLVLSAAGWLVVGVTTVGVLAAVVPTVTLAGVLVLGRRAVVQDHAADVAWERRRRVPLLAAATTEPVIGRAYHPSDEPTQVIARARTGAPSVEGASPAAPESVDTVEPVDQRGVARTSTEDTESEGWTPVPVPRPTYTTKAAAPRREPVPLVLDEPAGVVVSATLAVDLTADSTVDSTVDSTADPTPGATPTASADASSSGARSVAGEHGYADPASAANAPTLDLDAILARRRVAG